MAIIAALTKHEANKLGSAIRAVQKDVSTLRSDVNKEISSLRDGIRAFLASFGQKKRSDLTKLLFVARSQTTLVRTCLVHSVSKVGVRQ